MTSNFSNRLIQIQEWKTSSFSQAESGGISWEEIDQSKVDTDGAQNLSNPTHAGIKFPDEPTKFLNSEVELHDTIQDLQLGQARRSDRALTRPCPNKRNTNDGASRTVLLSRIGGPN